MVTSVNGAITSHQVNYKGKEVEKNDKVNISETSDTFEKQGESASIVSKLKKNKDGICKGVLSAILPGLGQVADGRVDAAAGYLVGCYALKNIAKFIVKQNRIVSLSKCGLVTAVVARLATAGLWIANIVNAVNGGKDKKVN